MPLRRIAHAVSAILIALTALVGSSTNRPGRVQSDVSASRTSYKRETTLISSTSKAVRRIGRCLAYRL